MTAMIFSAALRSTKQHNPEYFNFLIPHTRQDSLSYSVFSFAENCAMIRINTV